MFNLSVDLNLFYFVHFQKVFFCLFPIFFVKLRIFAAQKIGSEIIDTQPHTSKYLLSCMLVSTNNKSFYLKMVKANISFES